ELAPIVTREGPGNFGLLPNGVFCITDTKAEVIESRSFDAAPPACTYATQSGPMLVINGALHPRFLPDVTSVKTRNGVGVRGDGSIVAVISDRPVNFHQFARFFRDVLETPNALFLDGTVSRLYAPALNRHDLGLPMGPILGVID
ncbi:MAG: phosphodiester glycosidase family protein, partial [Paracoccaceae bacterium]